MTDTLETPLTPGKSASLQQIGRSLLARFPVPIGWNFPQGRLWDRTISGLLGIHFSMSVIAWLQQLSAGIILRTVGDAAHWARELLTCLFSFHSYLLCPCSPRGGSHGKDGFRA